MMQAPTEWQHDHEILKAYSDGVNEVLGNIRNEIEQAFLDDEDMQRYTVDECLRIIDSYITESEDKMFLKCELGYLRRGDEFYFEGTKYKSLYLKGNNFNNVVCKNLVTGKKEYFDIDTEVEVEDKK